MNESGRTLVFVCGRWDAELSVIDLDLALDPANQGTDRAVIRRPRVTPDIERPGAAAVPACGLPVSLAIGEGRIFVVNHGGNASPEDTARMPHGHSGTIAVLDVEQAIASDRPVLKTLPLGCGGPVGCVLTPDGRLLATSAEGEGTEDGGYRIAIISAKDARLTGLHTLRREGVPCPDPSPNRGFGGFPNPNGIAFSSRHGGIVFTGNGGTNDVSVLSYPAMMEGEPYAELTRIPVSSGAFGLALSPDEKILAVADREDAATGVEGCHVSLIDTDLSVLEPARAVIARVRVGTDDESRPSRPTGVAFAPAGRSLYVTCSRSGTVSRLDVAAALAGRREETRLSLHVAQGEAAPRGVSVTADGQFAVVSGGARSGPRSGTLWVLRTADLSQAGHVSGVGNEPYFLALSDG